MESTNNNNMTMNEIFAKTFRKIIIETMEELFQQYMLSNYGENFGEECFFNFVKKNEKNIKLMVNILLIENFTSISQIEDYTYNLVCNYITFPPIE